MLPFVCVYAQQVLEYARNLYRNQGNEEWAIQAEQLLQQTQNPNR
jgi:hypothetical protein